MKINIVGRIDLKGDFGGKFLTELNELFVEKYARRITMYEFKAPDVVLHSKILMIDGGFPSRRSISTTVVPARQRERRGRARPGFYARMRPVFDSYLARSNPLSTKVTIPWAYRWLFSKGWVKEAF